MFFNHIEEMCAITLLDQVITAMMIFRPTVLLQVYNNKINKMFNNLNFRQISVSCLVSIGSDPLIILVSYKAATNCSLN